MIDPRSRSMLALVGVGSLAIALLQVVIHAGGPAAYRAFGAPPLFAEARALEPGRMLLW